MQVTNLDNPFTLMTIIPINHHAYRPLCLSTIMPINHCAYQPSCLSTIMTWPLCLLTIVPINHHAYWPLCLSTIMPTDHHAYQPSGLLSQLLSLLACYKLTHNNWNFKNVCLHYSTAQTSALRFTVQNKHFSSTNLYKSGLLTPILPGVHLVQGDPTT